MTKEEIAEIWGEKESSSYVACLNGKENLIYTSWDVICLLDDAVEKSDLKENCRTELLELSEEFYNLTALKILKKYYPKTEYIKEEK